MNQLQQNGDFTPMLFRQKDRSMHEGASTLQQVMQSPQSGIFVIEVSIPGLNGMKLFGASQSQPWIYGLEFKAPANAAANTNSPKNAELNWLREHSEETVAYLGQWLLISGDALVAHSQNFADIKNAITENKISSPFVYYIPTEAQSSFVIL